jgi:hypothetical protein
MTNSFQPEAARLEPRGLASGTALVAYLAATLFLVHMALARNYGYFVDELYHLACAEHLAWGYVDQPSLIAVIGWLTRTLFGDSLPAIRFFPALAAACKVLLTGMIAREMGARRSAQALAALCVMVAPVYLFMDHIFTMNAFEPLFWMGAAWLVLRILRTGNRKLWLAFGALAGVGLHNKYSMLFFGLGVFIGLLLTPERRAFRQPWIWLGGLLALLIFLPNILWNIQHDFPFVQLQQNIRSSGRNVALNWGGFFAQQVLLMHPLTLPLWLAGLWWLLRSPAARGVRVLGWTFLVILACLLLLDGRVYYLAPAYPMLFAAGAIALQNFCDRRARWLQPSYAVLLAIAGAILAPLSLPALPVETYLRYVKLIGLEQPRIETHRLGPLPQLYADMHGWEEMAQATAAAYHKLPPEIRAKTAIFGNTYGQSGAIDLFGAKYGLPKSIGNHQTYWLWGYRDYTGESILVLGDSLEDAARACVEIEAVGEVYHPYSMPYNHFQILHCRGLRQPIEQMWPRFRNWN